MKEVKKKVRKILLSLTMVLTMALTIMPSNVFAASTSPYTVKIEFLARSGETLYEKNITVDSLPFTLKAEYLEGYIPIGFFTSYDFSFEGDTQGSYGIHKFEGSNTAILKEKLTNGQNGTIFVYYEEHTHTPATEWSKDATNHWHDCTASDGKQMELASHTFGDWVIDTPATESAKGSKHRDCTVCSQRENVEIPVLSHTHTPESAWSKDATNHWHECTTNDGEKMDLASHAFGNWVIDTPATEYEKGSKHRDCTVCGQRETVEILATGVTPEKPTITGGDIGSNHQLNSNKDMTLTCSGKLEDLTGIYVDGKLVDDSNYTLKSGSTILTLKTNYLDTLSAGKHTLKFQYKDNVSAETDFTITEKAGEAPVKPSSPKTGDTSSITLYIGSLVLAGCLASFGLKKRKYK